MKKIFVVALALCLAVPAISYAGNATSRFDIIIGGNVKIDIGYSNQGNTLLAAGGSVQSRDGGGTVKEDYGSQLTGAGETGLNFLVRGPDAWGAKTSAFIGGDFVGLWGGTEYGSFDLVVAKINFDWANTSLSIGKGGQIWGKLPTWTNNLAWAGQNLATKGSAPNLIAVEMTQRFTKEFSAKFGVTGTHDAAKNHISGVPNDFAYTILPFFEGGLYYSSGACGKVGPWQLTFGLDGIWGKSKIIYRDVYGDNDDEDVRMWLAEFKFLVPIIPEKNGNKTGALYVDGNIVTGQNTQVVGGPYTGTWILYDRALGDAPVGNITGGTNPNPDFASPVYWGYTLHGAFYFTDQLSLNLYYGYAQTRGSNYFFTQNALSAHKWSKQYCAALLYDVNPAIRFTFQYDYTKTKWQSVPGLKSTGTVSNYRVAAYYFF